MTTSTHRVELIFVAFPFSMSLVREGLNERHDDIQILKQQQSRPNENTYWVTSSLLAGEYPTDMRGTEKSREKLRRYLALGVNFFLDLTREGEKESYEKILYEESTIAKVSVEYRRLPVQDFGVPSKEEMRVILETIDSAIADSKTVYVHCRGGIGRTGTAVGCYLARHGYGGEEALIEVNRLFQNSQRSYESSCSPETNAQIRMVRDWIE